jgi:hypothetical protein
MANPLDTGSPVVPVATVAASLREVLVNEPVDIAVLMLLVRPLEIEVSRFMEMAGMPVPPPGAYMKQMLEELVKLKQEIGKDIVVVLENRAGLAEEMAVEATARKMRVLYQTRGFPVFSSAERALRGIRHAVSRVEHLAHAPIR